MELTQRPCESKDDYIHEMSRLKAQLRTPIDESEMVHVLKRNVREAVGKILFPIYITSVERLRAEYHAIERAFMKGNQNRYYPAVQVPRPYGKPQVNEVVHEEPSNLHWEDDSVPVIEEVHGKRLTCWNCHDTGHN